MVENDWEARYQDLLTLYHRLLNDYIENWRFRGLDHKELSSAIQYAKIHGWNSSIA